jgi:futalosine hydrolase
VAPPARSGILVVAATELELEIVGDLAPTLCCGIGPIEAGVHAAAELAREPRGAVLHVGLAGAARDAGIRVAELVLGDEAVYEDIAGDLAARMPRVERLKPDARLLAVAHSTLPTASLRPIGTTARVGAGRTCAVEAMEGFAVLRACQLAGVPGVELRAISNFVDDARADWRIQDALAALAAALPSLVASVDAALATAS